MNNINKCNYSYFKLR